MLKGLNNVKKVKPSGLELVDRLVNVNRVTKVTKGGRAFGFSAIVVVGNEHGVAGYGLGKSKEVSEAISKAVEDAKKNLYRISLIKNSHPQLGVHLFISLHINLFATNNNCHTTRNFRMGNSSPSRTGHCKNYV